MKIGIVGLGVVGNACRDGFVKGGHDVIGHDILFSIMWSFGRVFTPCIL